MINLTLLNFENPSNSIPDCKSFWLWVAVVQIRVIFNLAKVKNQEIIPKSYGLQLWLHSPENLYILWG